MIEKLYESGEVKDEQGNKYELHSALSMGEGNAVQKLIRENGFSKSIEVGCAYGMSSLHICKALSSSDDPFHLALDPNQSNDWHGIGRLNLKRAGYDFAEVKETPSEIALPRLLDKGVKFEFGLIDGWHTFDQALVDFFYINRVTEIGGVVVFHDAKMPAINKVVRYILNYPSYEVKSIEELDWGQTWKRKMLSQFTNFIPRRLAGSVFDDSFLRQDAERGISNQLVALRKVAEDERNSGWFREF